MITCRYCGSGRVETVGGPDGNPFGRKKQKTVCLSCGRTLWAESELADMVRIVVRIEMTGRCREVYKEAAVEIPYENGDHSFGSKDYPLNKFGGVTIRGDVIVFDGEERTLVPGEKLHFHREYTVYAIDHVPWAELIDVTVYTDIVGK